MRFPILFAVLLLCLPATFAQDSAPTPSPAPDMIAESKRRADEGVSLELSARYAEVARDAREISDEQARQLRLLAANAPAGRPIPEPATIALGALGFGCWALGKRRVRRAGG